MSPKVKWKKNSFKDKVLNVLVRETLLKGKARYSWPPSTKQFRSINFYIVLNDYLSISYQVYYWQLFTNVQSITTIYTHIYILYKHINNHQNLLRTHIYRHNLLKMPTP